MNQYQQSPQTESSAQNQQPSQQSQKHSQQQQSTLKGLEFPTSSHLPQTVRRNVVQQLNQILADSTILLTHASFAHWNVKGMSFYGLHQLFEDIAEMFGEHMDLVAERVTSLGGQAMGTAGIAVQNCGVPAMPTTIVTGQEYVGALSERMAIHNANLARAIETVTEWDDLDTADLLNELSREVSQMLWFLDAHLQTQPLSAGGAGGLPEPQGQQAAGSQQATTQRDP